MPRAPSEDDPLSQWLQDDGVATLDALTGEALDVIGVIDRELTLRWINWASPPLTREAVVGGSAHDLMPPDYREVARDNFQQVLRTGRGTQFETMYQGSDHVHMWDVRVGPIRMDGEVVGLIVITTNVTEQRRAEADRDRFFALSRDLLVVTGPDGRLKRVNPALAEMIGHDVDELVGRPFLDFVHPEDRGRTLEARRARQAHGAPITDFENRYRRADGQYRVLSWRGAADPITGDAYAVARDVTEQRATETQLRHAQKLEAVGQLAGGVAHDFNNLLQAILAGVELAAGSRGLSAEVAERLHDIEGAARRAADLTKQLLAFSRRQPLRPVPIDLNALTHGLMKMVRRLLPENIVVDLIPGHKLASIDADPSQMEQVIVNLCVNARDAMEGGGQLTIETENILINGRYSESHPWARPGRYVLLSVTDTGAGMTADVRERIFEPFFTTKGTHQGTGLGLATVYGIVRQHEGMIYVYSEPGEGTTFKVYLPAHTRLASEVGDEIEAMPPRGQETILLAEDEATVRRAVVEVLERAGYRTLAAENGLEAVRLLREQSEPVHLALLDVVMPDLGGPEAWKRLRQLRPELRVLFATGYADDRYVKSLPPDAEVLQKPFRMEELLRQIRKKLDE